MAKRSNLHRQNGTSLSQSVRIRLQFNRGDLLLLLLLLQHAMQQLSDSVAKDTFKRNP